MSQGGQETGGGGSSNELENTSNIVVTISTTVITVVIIQQSVCVSFCVLVCFASLKELLRRFVGFFLLASFHSSLCVAVRFFPCQVISVACVHDGEGVKGRTRGNSSDAWCATSLAPSEKAKILVESWPDRWRAQETPWCSATKPGAAAENHKWRISSCPTSSSFQSVSGNGTIILLSLHNPQRALV